MPNLRLTRRAVDEIPHPASGQVFYRDTMLTGFGLRVGKQSKVYYAEGQVNRQTRRVTIGRADIFAAEIARKRAMALLAGMAERLRAACNREPIRTSAWLHSGRRSATRRAAPPPNCRSSRRSEG